MKQRLVGLAGLFIATLALFSFTSHENSKDAAATGYKISFKIKGAADSVYLCRYYGDKRYYQDTAIADAKGAFVFEGKDALPEGMYFVLLPGQKFFDILVANQVFSIEGDTSNFVKYMVTKNSPDNKSFYDYQQFYLKQKESVDSINAKVKQNPALKEQTTEAIKAIDVKMNDYITNFKKVNAKSLFTTILNASEEVQFPEIPKKENGQLDSVFMYRYYKNHFFDKVDFKDDRLIRTPILAPKIDRYFKDLVTQSPDSIIKEIDWLLAKVANSKDTYEYLVRTLTYKYETSEIMGMDAVFVHMGKNYYEKGKCPWASKETLDKIKERTDILDPLLLGKKAPNLYMTDTTGKYVQLHSIKAKYTLVFFWDSNCGHCQKEVPKLFEMLPKLKPKGCVVYAANIERKNEGWIKFIKEKKLSDPAWFNVIDSHTHTDFKITYDIYSTPVLYILDENKKIIAKRITIEQLSDFLMNYEKSKK